MNMNTNKYRIIPYSVYDNYTVHTEGENISSIMDKLIRLSAKITEHYAGDIYYTIKMLSEKITVNTENLDYLILFRECGVTEFKTEDIDLHVCSLDSCCQAWHLTYDCESMETILERVDFIKQG